MKTLFLILTMLLSLNSLAQGSKNDFKHTLLNDLKHSGLPFLKRNKVVFQKRIAITGKAGYWRYGFPVDFDAEKCSLTRSKDSLGKTLEVGDTYFITHVKAHKNYHAGWGYFTIHLRHLFKSPYDLDVSCYDDRIDEFTTVQEFEEFTRGAITIEK